MMISKLPGQPHATPCEKHLSRSWQASIQMQPKEKKLFMPSPHFYRRGCGFISRTGGKPDNPAKSRKIICSLYGT
jgi:hypothetical protein